MSKIFVWAAKVKDKRVRSELVRAHVVIILLSLLLAFVLILATNAAIVLNMTLSVIVSVLLVLIALLSLGIIFKIESSNKK